MRVRRECIGRSGRSSAAYAIGVAVSVACQLATVPLPTLKVVQAHHGVIIIATNRGARHASPPGHGHLPVWCREVAQSTLQEMKTPNRVSSTSNQPATTSTVSGTSEHSPRIPADCHRRVLRNKSGANMARKNRGCSSNPPTVCMDTYWCSSSGRWCSRDKCWC